jgi:exonuclease SbcD
MRLLHTSDLHLGRAFHGGVLQVEQEAVIDSLVAAAEFGEVDLVIIAGDLFDRAIPPLEAVGLFDDAIVRLRETGAAVVAISGNHDSARRVGVHDRLLAAAGVTIRGDVSRCDEAVLLSPDDGGGEVAVYAVPYLDPYSSTQILGRVSDPGVADPGARPRRLSHDSITRLATARVRSDRGSRPGTRTIVVAHTFVAGGTPSESERDLSVGTIDHVGLDAFEGFDYVALGHLHGPQSFAGGRIAYSGSPLPYSFSEESHHKSARLVELGPDGSLSVELVPLDVGMRLRTITGELEGLLVDPGLTDAESARVRVVLTDVAMPVHAMARLSVRFPMAVELRHQPAGGSERSISGSIADRDRDLAPIDLVKAFWSDQHPTELSPGELALMADALESVAGSEMP